MRLPRRGGLLGVSIGLAVAGLWLSVGVADAAGGPGLPPTVGKPVSGVVQAAPKPSPPKITTAAARGSLRVEYPREGGLRVALSLPMHRGRLIAQRAEAASGRPNLETRSRRL